MRVVFMGTPEFAVPSLRCLATDHDVRCVFTAPDRPRSRGRTPAPSPVKIAALALGLAVEQPSSLRGEAEVGRLTALAPDVVCVAAYGLILPVEVLKIPPMGCLNVHASLLPHHRGAAPVHRAILEGDAVTGVSIMKMEEGMDTGPVALQVPVPVGEKRVSELTEELSIVGADALSAVLQRLECGDVVWVPQDESKATYAEKVTDEDVALSPDLPVAEVLRRVRASTTSARAKVVIGEKVLDILEAEDSPVSVGPGNVAVVDTSLVLGAADGGFVAARVRPAGKRTMDGAGFARGARLDRASEWRKHE